MIDKTMCEVLWRNISDIYVNLRVEVGKFYVRFLKIFYSETTGKFTLAMYLYQQFFQHRICFSIQPQLQLVNLHRNRRYFVIKLHTWFSLSYILKTNIKLYSIYQYFMSINSFFNTVSVSRYSRPITVTRDPD
jgi:hypothetical protein